MIDPIPLPKRDEFHRALASCLDVISSENRFTLFRIMPECCTGDRGGAMASEKWCPDEML
jgi:hypothetical protein